MHCMAVSLGRVTWSCGLAVQPAWCVLTLCLLPFAPLCSREHTCVCVCVLCSAFCVAHVAGTSKNCDWGEAGWKAFAANSTIRAQMNAALNETRLLNTIALDQPGADFWPLTPITPDETLWAAFQVHRPAHGDGFVFYFRRADAASSTFQVPWVGFDRATRASPHAEKEVSLEYRYSYEIDSTTTVAPITLAGHGLRVTLPAKASSLLIRYQAVHTTQVAPNKSS